MSPIQLKISVVIAAIFAVTGCSNGSGDSSSGRGSNSQPSLQLSDGDVLGGGSSVIRIPAGDDTGIARVGNTIVRQGRLQECSGRFVNDSLVADSLLDACVSDQPGCAVTFQPLSDQIEVIPPPLYAPIGLEYEISLVDRDGSATDPVKAVFCFDVGSNLPPVTAADTFQLTYPSRISRNGVRYNERCEKLNGSEGVLANDEDDEHITNTCLQAELVELPRYASNLSSFADTFRSDGGFVYEAIDRLPPEDAAGRSVDSFTYRVTDGVNPVSDPVRVEIVYTNENRAPLASDDSYEVSEDSEAQYFSVLDNDVDPDALPLSITRISNGPGNGVANIRNGVLVEYRPGAGFVGADSFSYTAVDSGGLTVTANVTINVANVNDAPMAQNDTVSTNENTPIEIRVRDNDSDTEGSALTVTSVAEPLNGVAVISATGNVFYTPDLNYSGPDSFEYTVSDGDATATATVVIQVIFVNVAPTPSADELFLSEGTGGEFDLLSNDTDGDGDTLTITNVSVPNNGTVVLLVSGNVRYTPNPGFSGNDTFNYTVSDGTVESTTNVTVGIAAVNDIPIAANDSAVTDENVPVSINVLGNDSDPDGNALTVVAVTAPSSGSAIINADARGVSYIPAENFSGQAGFTYTIDDGNGGTATASVSVVVSATNELPLAVDDSVGTAENDAVLISVLDNDSDPDGDPLSVAVVQVPTNGSASAISSGAIRYSPVVGFVGTDTFVYSVTDPSGLSATATVTVSVNNTNDAPIAVNDAAVTNENVAVEINVQANDSDPDGDSLSIAILQAPSSGSATAIASGAIRYTPATDFIGTDSFVYSVTDSAGLSATATVTVSVNNTNDAPVAVDDSVSTNENVAVEINVQGNDSDADGDSLTLGVTAPPSNGAVAIVSGGVLYTPQSGFSGVDQFSYSITDPDGASDTATVTITVSNVNQSPLAVNDTRATEENDPVSINVLANDSDPDGDALTLSVASQPANGTAAVNLPGTRIVYSPASGFSGADSFVYQVSDGNGGTASATVSITVSNVNAVPIALDDVAQATQGTAVNFNVLANDSDPDGDLLSVSIVTPPAGGTATVLPDNRITYTSAPAFAGADSISYSVDDGNGGSDSATVSITVASTNSPPLLADDAVTIAQGQTIDINVLLNDSDPDGDVVVLTGLTPASNGIAVINNNVVTYTPAPDYSGLDTFFYTASDSNNGAANATVVVTITAVNAVPVAVNDVAVTNQATAVTIPVLGNDSDSDGDALVVSVTTQPNNGSASVGADSQITYLPAAAFSGSDSFVYTIDDERGATATATVTITVNAVVVNQAPLAVNDVAVTDQDLSVAIDVLANDGDPDGDLLTFGAIVQPASGTVAINNVGGLNYTPAVGFSGVDAFTYEAADPDGAVSTATVSVTVNAVLVNVLPVAVDDAVTTDQGVSVDIFVLSNDTDTNGDVLAVNSVTVPTNGTAVVNGDGSVTYTPNAVFSGVDNFQYTVTDGVTGASTASVTITVVASPPAIGAGLPNTSPVALDDEVSVASGSTSRIRVLNNDSDADGDPLTLSIDSAALPSFGTVSLHNNGKWLNYTAIDGYVGLDSFGYIIDDAKGGSDTGLVTITIGSLGLL